MESITIALSKEEAKLLVQVLEMASDEFSNHGCNDFDLVKNGGMSPEQSYIFRKRLTELGDPDDDVSKTSHYTQDWLVMSYFAKLFSKQGD